MRFTGVSSRMLVQVVLVLALLAPGATPCLSCWPDTTLYFDYDVRLLLGDSLLEGTTRLDKKLHELFLDRENPGIQVMERERMEREAGKLFYHLDRIFTRYRHDPERLLKEAELERRNFTLRLKAATAAVLQQVCGSSCSRAEPFELAECAGCRLLRARCGNRQVCSSAAVIAGAVLGTLGAALALAAAAWACLRARRKPQPEPDEEAELDEEPEEEAEAEMPEEEEEEETPH